MPTFITLARASEKCELTRLADSNQSYDASHNIGQATRRFTFLGEQTILIATHLCSLAIKYFHAVLLYLKRYKKIAS